MKLMHDVKSLLDKDVIYGYAGDEVTVISEYGNVMIVEGINGVKFPCKTDNLTTEVLTNEKPLTEVKPIINQVQAKPVKRQKPAPLNNQSQLF